MATANILIEFEIEVKEVVTDCSPCFVCKDNIYGRQYQYLIYTIKDNKKTLDDKYNKIYLCESCASVLKK